MGAKKPMAEANKISRILRVIPEKERFPLDVKKLVVELTHARASDEPIESVKTFDITGIDGVLGRHPSIGKWKIGYNSRIQSPGRIRFTVAHEFGHYTLHRDLQNEFQCSTQDMHEWDGRDIEAEADVFASFLLMPLDDVREQVASQLPSIEMLRHCSNRYGVSLMAAALKWTEIAPKRAVVLAVRDGYVLWARSSSSAFRSRVFLASRKHRIQVPERSVLNHATVGNDPITAKLKANIWFGRESDDVEMIEHALAVGGDYPYTLGILLLPDAPPRWQQPDDELLTPLDGALPWRK